MTTASFSVNCSFGAKLQRLLTIGCPKWGAEEMDEIGDLLRIQMARAPVAIVPVVGHDHISETRGTTVVQIRRAAPQSQQAGHIGSNAGSHIELLYR